jgi:hypothetical protein
MDAGADDLVVAQATVTLQRPPVRPASLSR